MDDVVTIPRADYDRLLEEIEDLRDILEANRIMADVRAGREELIPGEVVNRLLDGEEPALRVWREHRGLSQAELARRSGVNRVQIVNIEAGRGTGSAATLRKLADVLGLDLDDLA